MLKPQERSKANASDEYDGDTPSLRTTDEINVEESSTPISTNVNVLSSADLRSRRPTSSAASVIIDDNEADAEESDLEVRMFHHCFTKPSHLIASDSRVTPST